jgi:hypothetical protein
MVVSGPAAAGNPGMGTVPAEKNAACKPKCRMSWNPSTPQQKSGARITTVYGCASP